MIVSSLRPVQARRADRKPAADQGDPPKPPSTALVPVMAPSAVAKPANGLARPNPAFVAHLIATAQLAPQTRVLRRASPEEAQAHYRTRAAATAARGMRMSKTV